MFGHVEKQWIAPKIAKKCDEIGSDTGATSALAIEQRARFAALVAVLLL